MSKKKLPRLPGDASGKYLIDQILRVNHAGEYGASRIYDGQLSVIKRRDIAETISHMKQQELVHLQYFEQKIIENKTRPSLLHPLWHVGGFMLGFLTAKMGKKYAFACTVGVEEVIADHYEDQLYKLDFLPNPTSAGNLAVDSVLESSCTLEYTAVLRSESPSNSLPEAGYARSLLNKGEDLAIKIAQFREEEIEHRDISIENQAKTAPLYSVFSSFIKLGCKIAIALAKKF